MNELIGLMNAMAKGLPCVVARCDVPRAAWYGKYHFLGARPAHLDKTCYDTEGEACAAIEAAGWTRRPPTPAQSGPHYDRPKEAGR